jgi:hypothetical protein
LHERIHSERGGDPEEECVVVIGARERTRAEASVPTRAVLDDDRSAPSLLTVGE